MIYIIMQDVICNSGPSEKNDIGSINKIHIYRAN